MFFLIEEGIASYILVKNDTKLCYGPAGTASIAPAAPDLRMLGM